MDPVTALALACNVTQLIEQAIEAAKGCKEFYERGSLIEKSADGLTAANKSLEAVLRSQTASTATRTTKLQNITKDVSETAAELKKLLNQLKLSKNQGNRKEDGA